MTDGYTAQNTILPQLSAFYATAGMTRDDVEKVSVASLSLPGRMPSWQATPSGFIFAHGAGKVREADAAVGGLRALGVDDSAAMPPSPPRGNTGRLRSFLNLKAGADAGRDWKTTPISPSRRSSLPMPMPRTMSSITMAKAMYENAQVMADTFPPFRAFRPENMKGDPGYRRVPPGRAEASSRKWA